MSEITKRLTFFSDNPQIFVYNLSDYLKYEIAKSNIKSKSNVYFILIILVLADNIFTMFIQNDNLKIFNIIKNLLHIYERCIKKIKQKYFYKYKITIEVIKKKIKQNFHFTLNRQSIHNKLYDLKNKEKQINELTKKINNEENKQCSFTPELETKLNNIQKYYINHPISAMRNMLEKNKNLIEESKLQSNRVLSITELLKGNNIKKKRNKKIIIDNQITQDNHIKKICTLNIPNYLNKRNKNIINDRNQFRKIQSSNNLNSNKLKEKKSFKPSNLTTISGNLSLLFSSRLNNEGKKIEYKKEKKLKKRKNSQINISCSTITNEKGTNYLTGSRTEHLSTLNLEDKNKNDKRKSYSIDYNENIKTRKIPYSFSSRPINNNYSLSNKGNYYFSPRHEISYEKFNIRNNRNNLLNNYLEQDDFSKRISLQNTKSKTATIIIEGINTVNSTIKNNSNCQTIKKNNNELEIVSKIVEESIINKNDNNNNINISNISDEKKNSNYISLQTISDSKLFDLASQYVNTDESLERFRLLTKIENKKLNQQKGTLKINKRTKSPLY